jgi:hypothetical protein
MKEYSPLTDVESVLSMLSQISFLGGVSDAERDCIFRRLEIGVFKRGEYVSMKGDVPSHIYIIKRGKIDLLLTGGGAPIKKREFKAGECFGEAALLSMINNTASFVAAEDSEVIVLSRRALNQLRGDDPKVFCVLILNLARELARKLQFTGGVPLLPPGRLTTLSNCISISGPGSPFFSLFRECPESEKGRALYQSSLRPFRWKSRGDRGGGRGQRWLGGRASPAENSPGF